MKLHKFTVKIDLSTFFDDERKFVLILCDPGKWSSVEELQMHVEMIFGLHVQFLSAADDCFIPPQEPIEVLKFVDSIKAIVPFSHLAKKLRREHAVTKEQKKRKLLQSPENCCLTSSTPNQAKRSKNDQEFGSTAVAILEADKSDEITSTCEALNERQTKETNKEVNRTLMIGPVQVEISPAQQHHHASEMICNGDEEAPEPVAYKDESKRKRKRAQKKKSNARSLEQSENSTAITKFATKSSALEKTLANGSHVHYTEYGEAMSASKEDKSATENSSVLGENTVPVVFHCALTEFSFNKPRVFTMRKKERIEIREHLVLTPIGSTPNRACGQPREVRGADVTVTNIENQSSEHYVEDPKHLNSSMSRLLYKSSMASVDEPEENIDTAQLPISISLNNLTEVVLKAESVQPKYQFSGNTIISLDESSVIDDDYDGKDCQGDCEGETDVSNMIDLS